MNDLKSPMHSLTRLQLHFQQRFESSSFELITREQSFSSRVFLTMSVPHGELPQWPLAICRCGSQLERGCELGQISDPDLVHQQGHRGTQGVGVLLRELGPEHEAPTAIIPDLAPELLMHMIPRAPNPKGLKDLGGDPEPGRLD